MLFGTVIVIIIFFLIYIFLIYVANYSNNRIRSYIYFNLLLFKTVELVNVL